MEYIGAIDEFQAGELSFDAGRRSEPTSWNVELAVNPMEKLSIAGRYSGTDDIRGGAFLPETQFGAVTSYEIFGGISVSLEYLHNEFQNDDRQHIVTGQLAAEF